MLQAFSFQYLIYLCATEVEEEVEVGEVAMVVVDAETTMVVQIGTTVAGTVQIHTELKPEQFMYLKSYWLKDFFCFSF